MPNTTNSTVHRVIGSFVVTKKKQNKKILLNVLEQFGQTTNHTQYKIYSLPYATFVHSSWVKQCP